MGNFSISGDNGKKGIITVQSSLKAEMDLELENSNHFSQMNSTNSHEMDDKQIEENVNQNDLELFGPKLKFLNDISENDMVNTFYKISF